MTTASEVRDTDPHESIAGGTITRVLRPRSVAGAVTRTLDLGQDLLPRAGALAGELVSAAGGRAAREPGKGDRRFADPAWTSNPIYRRLGGAYLSVEHHINSAVEHADVDWRTYQRARFAAEIVSSALAPTNTLLGNPAALKHAFDTGGLSLLRGARNLVDDIRHNRGMPRQVDASPFRVGENVAATPGEVVFRNEVVEIIQYTPTTETVRSLPLLVVWSVVNRYYVLDLGPGRSFVEHALSQGIQVFVTSWRNPTNEHRTWNLDTYAAALLEAVDAVRDITGSDQVGTVGLCAGGQVLASTMAHLADRGDDRIAYGCFGVSQMDMEVPNVAAIALHPTLTGAARWGTKAAGVVDGRGVGAIFSWLRPNELVWSAYVNNYLMGEPPPKSDILAWNGDTTRIPGAMQRDLLRIAERNLLAQPGGLTVLGTRVDLGQIKVDTYVVGAESDHLVPWRGAYRSTQLVGGDSTFVLSGGGHVQHLVNPPGNPRAYFHTGPAPGANADAWLAASTREQGTWWTHWAQWALERSGEERPAPTRLGSDRHPAIEPAPGRYVKEQ